MATRQGLRLEKSPRRDPPAFDYGRYMTVNVNTTTVITGLTAGRPGMTIDEVEAFLRVHVCIVRVLGFRWSFS